MLKLTTLPASPGRTQARVSGYCRPGHFAADACAFAHSARNVAQAAAQEATAQPAETLIRALLLALVLCPLSLLLTHCIPVASKAVPAAPAPRDYRTEHATPGGRYAWTWADSQAD